MEGGWATISVKPDSHLSNKNGVIPSSIDYHSVCPNGIQENNINM